MGRTVTLDEASRRLSALVDEVGAGETYVLTVDGRAVAQLSPVADTARARDEARRALLARLHSQPLRPSVTWTRDELYDDEWWRWTRTFSFTARASETQGGLRRRRTSWASYQSIPR